MRRIIYLAISFRLLVKWKTINGDIYQHIFYLIITLSHIKFFRILRK